MCDTPDGDVLTAGIDLAGADPANIGPERDLRGRAETQQTTSALRLTLAVAGVVVVLDQTSKWWAESRLTTGICSPETCIEVLGTRLRFHLVYNTGAAFSTGEGLGWLIGPLALLMAGYLLLLARRTSDRFSLIGLGLVAGGALGNLVDRVIRAEDGIFSGGVIDFIDFQFWPVFNVADMGVVGGVTLLLIRQMFQPKISQPNGSHDG